MDSFDNTEIVMFNPIVGSRKGFGNCCVQNVFIFAVICKEVGHKCRNSVGNDNEQDFQKKTFVFKSLISRSPGACKIRRGCYVLQVPIQIIPLGIPKWGAIPSVADQNCDGMSPDYPSR